MGVPMEYLPLILTISVVILTVVLVVVGVYVVQVLQQVKRTLERVNDTIDLAEAKIVAITSPLQSFTGLASSVGSGLRVFESFVSWMNRNKKEK